MKGGGGDESSGAVSSTVADTAIPAMSYGPEEAAWRARAISLTAFAHATRRSLGGKAPCLSLERLLTPGEASEISPSGICRVMSPSLSADTLRQSVQGWADRPRCCSPGRHDLGSLVEHVGGCERIRNTPLPRAYSVIIRQFLFVFPLTLPFGLLKKVGDLTPLVSIPRRLSARAR